jgi:hypothetical protein
MIAEGGGSEPENYAGSEKSREKYSGGNPYAPSPPTGEGSGGRGKLTFYEVVRLVMPLLQPVSQKFGKFL